MSNTKDKRDLEVEVEEEELDDGDGDCYEVNKQNQSSVSSGMITAMDSGINHKLIQKIKQDIINLVFRNLEEDINVTLVEVALIELLASILIVNSGLEEYTHSVKHKVNSASEELSKIIVEKVCEFIKMKKSN